MKFFFMSGLAGSDGENNVASEAIRYKIKGYIEKESVKKVLSDDHIVSLLEKERITIARRTVAKYREAMGIPSSVERRRLKKLGM
jgi:RNA polymerase sigma-54 factor